jgi:hypothetical protein
MTKHDRPVGVRQRIRDYIPGNAKCCTWHRESGVPVYAMGKQWRFPGCPRCDEKLAAGKVTADAPTPEQLLKQYKADGRAKGQRASVCARRTKARAAVSRWYLVSAIVSGRTE